MFWACKSKAFGNTFLSDRLPFAPACQKIQVSEENERHPRLAGHYSCQVPSSVIFLLKVMGEEEQMLLVSCSIFMPCPCRREEKKEEFYSCVIVLDL